MHNWDNWRAGLEKVALPEARLEARLRKKSEKVKELEAQLDAALFVVGKQVETISNLLKRVKA